MYDEHRTSQGRVFAPLDGQDATRFWYDHETWANRRELELQERHGESIIGPALTQREEVERIERRYGGDVKLLLFYVKQELGLELTGDTIEEVYRGLP